MLKFSPLMPPVMFTSSLHSRANIEKDDAVQCEVASSNGQFKVIITFWNSMQHLPCRHIFAVPEHWLSSAIVAAWMLGGLEHT